MYLVAFFIRWLFYLVFLIAKLKTFEARQEIMQFTSLTVSDVAFSYDYFGSCRTQVKRNGKQIIGPVLSRGHVKIIGGRKIF